MLRASCGVSGAVGSWPFLFGCAGDGVETTSSGAGTTGADTSATSTTEDTVSTPTSSGSMTTTAAESETTGSTTAESATTESTTAEPENSTGVSDAGCQQLATAKQQLADEYCPCAVQIGLYPDLQGCVDAQAEPMVMMCRCEVYAGFPDTDAALQCQADAIPALIGCLQDAMCANQAITDKCFDDYRMAVMATCPPLDMAAADAAMMQCG